MESILSNTVFLVTSLCGIIYVITAVITLKYPPKAINYLYGYRTERSMKSEESWKFSQEYSSKKLRNYGLILLLISFISLFFDIDEIIGVTISILIVLILTFMIYIQTENKLKKFH
jgi:uncharacterized membrane protein